MYADIEISGPNVLAIRPDSGFLFLSNNQGANWVRVNQLINNASAQYLSLNNNTFYVSTPQGLYSSGNGLAYTIINPSPADFGRLTWVNDTAYAATAAGVKRSTDGGMSFTTIALSGRSVRHVAVAGNMMYAVVRGLGPVQDTVLYSNNGGASFSAAPFSASFLFNVINDIAATSRGLVVGTDYGMYATYNNGSSWGRADSGYHATTVRGLAISGPYVFAGASPMGLYRAMPDSGMLVWQHTGGRAQGVDGNINTIAAHGPFIHAGGSGNYYRSADSGATWTAGTMGISFGNITSIYASPSSSDVWMIRNGNLYLSSNDGLSFGQVVNSNIPNNQSQYVTRVDTIIFVATSNGALYKGGNSMVFNATSGTVGRITAITRTADSTIWAATDGFGLFSSKTGTNWTPVPPGNLPAKINTLIADSATLIAGTDNGLYANTSGPWMQTGLQDHVVLSLAIRAGKLFAGTCSGAYSIPYKITAPPSTTSVNGLRLGNGSMEVFPNPAGSDFTIRVNAAAAGSGEVLLRNMLGVTVLQKSIVLKGGRNELQVSARDAGLAPGVYLIQVAGADIRATGRIVLR